jgi:F1F0 ATPase subunit 2
LTLAFLLVRGAIFVAAGLALGFMHFGALRLNGDMYLTADRRARAIGVHAIRMALIAGAWFAVAHAGAEALLAAFTGFLVARWMSASWVLRASERDLRSTNVRRAS